VTFVTGLTSCVPVLLVGWTDASEWLGFGNLVLVEISNRDSHVGSSIDRELPSGGTITTFLSTVDF
jgi:hypothetical protein